MVFIRELITRQKNRLGGKIHQKWTSSSEAISESGFVIYPMGIKVCFEDKYMIVVNKPNNVLIHHSFMARNMDEESTLIDLLQQQLYLKLYPVHRLDRKTSGVILLVKKMGDVKVF